MLSYATGPNAGQVITNPALLNGNGLVLSGTLNDINLESLNNATNDLRISRVFNINGNELTATFGSYNSRQTIDADWMVTQILLDVRGDGGSSLLNVRTAAGVPITQDGFVAFGNPPTNFPIRSYRSQYNINAPFASFNYRMGGLALGASVRYDFGDASGSRVAASLGGGRVGTTSRDVNGDGVSTRAETLVSIYPTTRPAPFEYDFSYLSYSASANWRISDPWAVFGRYSRGGRVYADRSLFTPYVSATTGQMLDGAEVDFVEQAEAGVKYRHDGLTLNLTGFWAKSDDTNSSPAGIPFQREYGAVGLEFEGGYTRGIFSIMGGATYTKAELKKDALNPALEGNTPRNQADLVYQVTPQIKLDRLNVGAVLIGTTESFAADSNLLVMPGFATTNAFVQYELTDAVLLSVNANNVFDVDGFVGIDEATIPVSGIVSARPMTGRNISASVRLNF